MFTAENLEIGCQYQGMDEAESREVVGMLRDIAGFRGNRAIEIQDNHAFWKRVLTAYGNDAMKRFQLLEESQQQARLKRIRSAPVLGKREDDQPNRQRDEKLLPKRCQSAQDRSYPEMNLPNSNRAAKLRSDYISHLHSLNKYSALTRMADYQEKMRANRPSHSARYPRFVQKEKTDNDPEWGEDEYDVYIFHNKRDSEWVSSWLKGPLQAKRYNVKMRATSKDIARPSTGKKVMHRIIIVLTPEFIRRDIHQLENVGVQTHVLLLKLKQCQLPEGLFFSSYVDLSFRDRTDLTLQSKLLAKLIATLQLPRPICS
ncbi:uncharacterized protein LOC135688992 isoform X2 [Rhopilema esculentum]|uniref:uncharacterized protein LOC135688992 isoform X2 n=1 Tax=Rhopilema esculentum TaxID=499914 RepID=UPI0031CF2063